MITSQSITTPQGTQKNYFITREDYWRIDLNMGVDLTDKQIDMTIRVNYDTTPKLEKTAIITDIPLGLANIVITKDDTPTNDYVDLAPGKYIYDIQMKTVSTDGDRDTFQFGTVIILDHVTTA